MNVEEAVRERGSGCVMVEKLGSADVSANFVSVMNNRCRDFNRIFVFFEDWRTMAVNDTRSRMVSLFGFTGPNRYRIRS